MDPIVICDANRLYLLQALKASSIRVVTSARVEDLNKNSIVITVQGKTIEIPFSDYSVVEATGYQINETFQKEIKNAGKEVYVIGDANKIGNVYTAVKDAYNVVTELCLRS